MAKHRDVVLYELLDDGIVIFHHLAFFCLIRCDELISLFCREMLVRRCKDRKHLTAVQRFVVSTGLYYLREVAQVTVLRDGLPERGVNQSLTFVLIVVVPGVSTRPEGHDRHSQSQYLTIYII